MPFFLKHSGRSGKWNKYLGECIYFHWDSTVSFSFLDKTFNVCLTVTMKRSKQNLKPWFDFEENKAFRVLRTFKKLHTVRMSRGYDHSRRLRHYGKSSLCIKRWKSYQKRKINPKMASEAFLRYKKKLQIQRFGENEIWTCLFPIEQANWVWREGTEVQKRRHTFSLHIWV